MEINEPQEGAGVNENSEDNEDALDVLSGLSPEDLVREVKKLRTEAARRRTSNKEKDAALAELAEIKKSQMTEAERLKAENAEMAKTVKELRTEKLQTKFAKEHDIEDYADLIVGETEDEMKANAKKLAVRLNGKDGKAPASRQLFPGRQGKPVSTEGKEDDARSAFNAYLRGGSDT